jgi:signal transduction histidine kinase/CheY-like chemotaxis protein
MTGLPPEPVPRAPWPLQALLLASVLGPLLLLALASWQDYRHLDREAEQDVRKTVDILHEHAVKVLETVELVLARVNEHVAAMGWDEIEASEPLHLYLKKMDESLPQTTAIWLIDADGRRRNSSVFFPTPSVPPAVDRDYFVALKQEDLGTFIGQADAGSSRIDRRFFNVAHRRGSADGRFDGIIVVSLSPEYFADFYRTMIAGPDDAISLLRSDGVLLARGPEPLVQPFAFNLQSVIMQAIGQADSGVFSSASQLDGVERLTGYRKLANYPIYVTYGMARATIAEQWHRDVAIYTLIAAAGALSLYLVSLLALRRSQKEQLALARWRETATGLRQEILRRQSVEATLRQAQKMEAIGQLTGGIAHDFNNLLTVIMGNIERLQRRLPLEDEGLRRLAAAALGGANRAATLTQRLLAFSRQQPLEPTSIELNRLVGEMSELLHRTLGERITIETVLAAGLWRAFADAHQLENALLNLVLNARDAMPAGGTLTIESANVYLDDDYAAQNSEVQPGQYVLLAVSDTGTGMAAETAAKAFEPFFTTKDIGKGSGLGLSMVYGFAKQSQGQVKIDSEIGQGTTVKLYLPRAPAQVDRPEAAAAPVEAAAETAGATILVVEDDDAVRDHTAEILGELGYRVLQAPDAETALRLIDQQTAIALLFTDVGLPGVLNGRSLAEEARRRRPGLKVLFTTGYSRNAIDHNGVLDQGVNLVVKPFTFDALAAKIASVLAMD